MNPNGAGRILNKSLLCLASAFSIGGKAHARAILRVPKLKVETSHFNSRTAVRLRHKNFKRLDSRRMNYIHVH